MDRATRTILILALAPAVGLGIGRFCYALILPDMRATLGWSYAQAGLMNTANAAGYLLGALSSPWASRLIGPARAVRWGTAACLLSMALCAVTPDFVLLTLARFLAGAGPGIAFVAGGALAAGLAQQRPERAGLLLGLFYAGPGFGIVLSGVVTPFLLDGFGPGSWWIAWAVLAALSAPLALALRFARAPGRAGDAPRGGRVAIAPMLPALVGYGCFGVGYIAYMTFMIAWIRDAGGGPARQALFWAVIGVAGMAAARLWSRLLADAEGGRAIALLTLVILAGAAVPLLFGGALASLVVSGLLFGSAFFAVVAATTAFVRRNLPQALWPAGIAAMTVAFGIGQTFGPFMTGLISDHAGGGLAAGLWASVGFLALGAAISGVQRDLRRA